MRYSFLKTASRVLLAGMLAGAGAPEAGAQSAAPASRPLVNQAGYNLHEGKRFVLPYAPEGLEFQVLLAADSLAPAPTPLYVGRVKDQAGDFSAFNPPRAGGQYVIRLAG